jgi:hypothetical protein
MAAHTKSQKRQRNNQIKTPCTLDEFNAITAKAEQAGLSTAAFSRTVLLGDAGPRARRRPHPDRKLLLQVLGQIGRIGGNINQISHRLNTGDKSRIPELPEALRAYLDIRTAIFTALGMNTTPEAAHDNQGNQPRRP